jgi:hypothetical protein
VPAYTLLIIFSADSYSPNFYLRHFTFWSTLNKTSKMGFLTVVAIVSGLIEAMRFRAYCDRDPVLPAPSHLSYIGHAWYYLCHKGCFRLWLGCQVMVHAFSILVAIDQRSWNFLSSTPETNDPLTRAFWKAKLSFGVFTYIISAFMVASIARAEHGSN